MSLKSYRNIGGGILGFLLAFFVFSTIYFLFQYYKLSSEDPLTKAVRKKDVAQVDSLLNSGADVNPKNNLSPLHIASEYGPKQIVVLLLEFGADINARTRFDVTPLHFAAIGGDTSIAQLLISKRAQVDAEDDEGRKPLLWILGRDWASLEMIDLLALHEDALWIWSSVRSEKEYDQMVEFLRTDDEFRNLTMKRLDKSEKEIEDYITRLKNLR